MLEPWLLPSLTLGSQLMLTTLSSGTSGGVTGLKKNSNNDSYDSDLLGDISDLVVHPFLLDVYVFSQYAFSVFVYFSGNQHYQPSLPYFHTANFLVSEVKPTVEVLFLL